LFLGPFQSRNNLDLRGGSDMSESYDVAVSFLQRDEPLALEIHSKLSESFSIFVYSKNQEELAGTDGLEAFREVFRRTARLVVVLYREGWGKTRWTRVEEAAIKDRFLDEGWEWLLFVTLDDARPPKWLPDSEIRLSYTQYGLEQLLGAIKLRAQKVGAELRTESALDRAARLEKTSAARAERERLLLEKGSQSAQLEFKELADYMTGNAEQIAKNLTTLKIETTFDGHEYMLRTEQVGMNVFLHQAHPVTNTRIVLLEFDSWIIFRHEKMAYSRTPVGPGAYNGKNWARDFFTSRSNDELAPKISWSFH